VEPARPTDRSVRSGQSTTYTYDAFERLTQVTGSAIPATTYTYDSLDRLAQRNASNFAYHDLGNEPVASPSAAGETKLLRDPLGGCSRPRPVRRRLR
jgi:YD repeat-containing protein